MADPIGERETAAEPLRLVASAAEPYLAGLGTRRVYDPATVAQLSELDGPLPDQGAGSLAAVERLLRVGTAAATGSAGPRYYNFVTGGATPAALAADWTTALLDQNALGRGASPLAAAVERTAIRWLLDLFGLPAEWGGALVASATFANFTGLACATHWWGEEHGEDTSAHGLVGLPAMPVLTGGYVHPSARKALQMLGHGRDRVEVFARDTAGRVDPAAMERRLVALDGAPAVIIANAGEVNTGDFDPIADLADLAERYGAWLHVDGAFGLFAAVSPRSSHLVRGVERAQSVAADGHKWLNVPYESGFAFLAEPERLARAFGYPGAAYLPDPAGTDPYTLGMGSAIFGPESSRRARCLPIWATLAAYGRDGYRLMVERHLDLARYLAGLVDSAPDLERLAAVPLNVVCFRYHRPDLPEPALNDLNRRVGEALLADGRVYAGTTTYQGKVALRPAFSNWRSTQSDVDLLLDVVRELGARLAG